eukprot:CAMPEP_0198664100 /NCGR_PEP_ID=MMETSP1467-20131203/54831_1 /TAXON_ID=1462469 /ORGANISM="unid. sp., Strain CCMP2135" /LENGTH=282 /DNA_ID=CAMNT_0044400653 /DNA_START=360 /DNA_END=1205 /DNA_ORIENTATION=-
MRKTSLALSCSAALRSAVSFRPTNTSGGGAGDEMRQGFQNVSIGFEAAGANMREGIDNASIGIEAAGADLRSGIENVSLGIVASGADLREGIEEVSSSVVMAGVDLRKGIENVSRGVVAAGMDIRKAIENVSIGVEVAGANLDKTIENVSSATVTAGMDICKSVDKVGVEVEWGFEKVSAGFVKVSGAILLTPIVQYVLQWLPQPGAAEPAAAETRSKNPFRRLAFVCAGLRPRPTFGKCEGRSYARLINSASINAENKRGSVGVQKPRNSGKFPGTSLEMY